METSGCNDNDVVQLTKIEKSPEGEDVLRVDMDAVKSVLGNPEYKDYYAAVYAIAGPTRTGKSFLLNLLSNFLGSTPGQNLHQWLLGKQQLKKTFEWKKGPNSHTKGIFILKKPHLVVLEEKTIALFLVDTQGFGDHTTSELNQTFLGTFSLLLSSLLIFNVQNRISPTHLEKIHKFGINVNFMEQESLMVRSSLMFVVRDHVYVESNGDSGDDDEDFAYGTEGGKKYFHTIIQDNSSNKATEHKILQEFLEYAFGNDIPCCLLPQPGNAIGRKSCKVADLDKEFQQECFKLFQKIASNKKVKIKRMQEVVCTCKTLCGTIQDYVGQFGPYLAVDGEYSTSRSKRLIKVKMSSYVRKYVNQYIDFCQQAVKTNCSDTHKAAMELQTTKQNSVLKFKKETAPNYIPSVVAEWEEELNRILSQIKINLVTCMFIETAYKKAILKFNKWQKSNIGTRSEDEKDIFRAQAEQKRSDLLREMKEKIRRCPEKANRFEEIFSQCEKYFVDHTNKVTAAIDKDNDRFLKAMKVLDFVFGGIWSAISFVIPPLSETEAPHKTLGKRVTERVMSNRVNDNTRFSLGLQNYRYGKLQVELSFGPINFDFDIGEQLSA